MINVSQQCQYISVYHKLQKFMKEQNKTLVSQATAMRPSDPSVPIGLSLVSALTTTNIKVVVQQFYYRFYLELPLSFLSLQVHILGSLMLYVVTI